MQYAKSKKQDERRTMPFAFCLLHFTLNQRKSSRAFTLIEMLVAITLFTVIMISAVGSLIAINDANRKTQAVRSAVDNVNFALDNISRRLRTGKNYHCLSSAEAVYPGSYASSGFVQKDCTTPESAIAFIAADFLGTGVSGDTGQSGSLAGGTVVYRLGPPDLNNENRRAIEMATRESDQGSFSAYTKLTSPDVDIEQLNFVVDGAPTGDSKQPYVLITLRGSVDTSKGSTKQKTSFKVQTTVSQRLLDTQ